MLWSESLLRPSRVGKEKNNLSTEIFLQYNKLKRCHPMGRLVESRYELGRHNEHLGLFSDEKSFHTSLSTEHYPSCCTQPELFLYFKAFFELLCIISILETNWFSYISRSQWLGFCQANHRLTFFPMCVCSSTLTGTHVHLQFVY